MDEVAQLVQRLGGDLSMELKVVGHDKDFIISPNLLRGWEARDKQFGDNAHNSLRAELDACDSPLAQDSKAPAWSQEKEVGQQLVRRLLEDRLVGAAASSSDAPPPPALDHHFEDTAIAGNETGPSTPVEGFIEHLDELGATAEWKALPYHEQGAVLDKAIELNAQRAKGDDRCPTAHYPGGEGNDPNSFEAE